MINWERLRNMMRPDLMRIISQEKLSDKDYCDLKLILTDMERTYTNEMFEKDYYGGGESKAYNKIGSHSYHESPNYSNYSGRIAPYYDRYDASHGTNYSGHSQEDIFKSQLQAMAHTAEDANTRRVIQEAMDKLR